MTPSIIKRSLTGYGLNGLFTYAMDISFWPRLMWNSFWELLGFNFLNWLFRLFNLIPDSLTFLLETPQNFYGTCVFLFRYFFGINGLETFGWWFFVIPTVMALTLGLILCFILVPGLSFWGASENGILDPWFEEAKEANQKAAEDA